MPCELGWILRALRAGGYLSQGPVGPEVHHVSDAPKGRDDAEPQILFFAVFLKVPGQENTIYSPIGAFSALTWS